MDPGCIIIWRIIWNMQRPLLGLHLPVSQWSVLAGAPIEAWVDGVSRTGQVDCLTAPTATLRSQRGRQWHQRDVTRAESHRCLAEWNLIAATSRLAAVCVWAVIHTHLRDGHAQNGLQLKVIKKGVKTQTEELSKYDKLKIETNY